MEHTITEAKEWPKGLEVCYHDWVVKASKEEITKALGFKPQYNKSGDKWTYQWRCLMDGGLYFFTIYDMSYGQKLGKDEETEFHIGFDCKYDDIHNFWSNKVEALDMLWALKERGLLVQHSDIWTLFHSNGTLEELEKIMEKVLKNEK